MRGPWSWRRFPLLVQPLFKFQELFEFLPAWAERSDPGRSALFRWGLGGDDFWAYVGELLVLDLFFEGGELSVPTWADFWERGSSGWSFLPPFPTVSHSAFASSELTVGDEGGVGFFFTRWCGRDYGSLLFCVYFNHR